MVLTGGTENFTQPIYYYRDILHTYVLYSHKLSRDGLLLCSNFPPIASDLFLTQTPLIEMSGGMAKLCEILGNYLDIESFVVAHCSSLDDIWFDGLTDVCTLTFTVDRNSRKMSTPVDRYRLLV